MSSPDGTRGRRWRWIGVYLLLGLLFGVAGFVVQPLSVHFELAKFLSETAATLFGILGIWIAVLDPKALLNASVEQCKSTQQELLRKLLGPWLNATATLMLSVIAATLLAFSLPLEGGESPLWQLQFAAGANLLLLLLLLDSMIGTLVPISLLRKKITNRALRKANRD